MSVTVPSEVVQEEEQKAAQQLASRARLKGFRKGRVPTHLIETRFGGALRQEALDRLIGDAYRQALASTELRPISEGAIEDVQYAPAEDLSFSIAFDVEPVFEVAQLGGFAVERPVPDVTDSHVDEVLERIREQAGVWIPAETGHPTDRDLVSVKILKLTDTESDDQGREYDFILGQGDAIADIEDAIKTLEPKGAGEFEVSFPDDFPDETRRGTSENVRITLESRRILELPELDDDLARQAGDFETLEDLKKKVREDVQREADERAEAVVRGRLLEFLLEANPFEVPISMIDRYTESLIGEQKGIPEDKLEEVREQLKPEAERIVKRILIIERIAQTQSLAATEEDIDARIEEIAEANDANPAKVYAELQKAGRIEALERDLTEHKVFDFLREQSEITDAPVT